MQPGAYGFDAIAATAAAAGPSIKGFPSPLNDPTPRQDLTSGITQTIRDVSNERPSSLRNLDGIAVPGRESNILFVDKLPNDCTRREVGRILFLCNVFSCYHAYVCVCVCVCDILCCSVLYLLFNRGIWLLQGNEVSFFHITWICRFLKSYFSFPIWWELSLDERITPSKFKEMYCNVLEDH